MFIEDGRTVTFLGQMGVKQSYTNCMTFAQLIPNWENVNWGRPRARVDEAVVEYALLTERGSQAPAPILHSTTPGYEILDGVQRILAAKLLNATEFSAYIVETDSPSLARAIRVVANKRLQGGHSESSAWCRKQAVSLLIFDQNMSIKEVAQMGGWSEKSIEEDYRARLWERSITQIGGPEEMNKGVLLTIAANAKLDDLVKAPKPIAAFCDALKTGRFGNGESEIHVKKFFDVHKGKQPLARQLEDHLNQFRSHPDVKARLEGRAGTRRTPEMQVRAAVRNLVTVTENLVKSKTGVPYPEEFFQGLNQARKNIEAISKFPVHA